MKFNLLSVEGCLDRDNIFFLHSRRSPDKMSHDFVFLRVHLLSHLEMKYIKNALGLVSILNLALVILFSLLGVVLEYPSLSVVQLF